jgi:protein TonB
LKQKIAALLTIVLFLYSSAKAQTDSAQVPKTDSAIYYNPETKAAFPGGTPAWYKYLAKNLRYPDKAVSAEVQGIVEVQFIVEADGSTHDFNAVSGPKELREESVRIYKNSGPWEPAMQNGRKVKSYAIMPIRYKLEFQR